MTWGLILFWLLAASGYIAGALRQKDRLNLSATAGGQMPYLVYAQHVALDGLLGHFGDRNRMPLIPILVSLAHDANWQHFVHRASWLAIALSLALLAAMSLIAYRNLSPLFATAFILMVAVAVFAPQASFVQADVAYYALFFCTWWAMVRVIDRPSMRQAIVVGLFSGLTYLTKASVLLAIPLLLGVLLLRALLVLRSESSAASHQAIPLSSQAPQSSLSRRSLCAALVALIVFLVTIFPYLYNNHARYGRYFYNVNTTFFVWCDSWPQAQQFAEKYHIEKHFPAAPAQEIPGMQNYWRTHSTNQIGNRIVYGIKTLALLAAESGALKYLLILCACGAVLSIIHPSAARNFIQKHRLSLAFSILLFCAYALAYSWYVVIAYGDRFVLSLVPPLLFALCKYIDTIFADIHLASRTHVRFAPRSAFATALILLTLANGVFAANTTWVTPSESFVRFYYDESREELRRGNLDEARRGMHGVLTLDPGFAPAHRDLGMIALAAGRHEDAIQSLSKAAALEPGWADVQNSLGSALIQAGRVTDAVPVLVRATTLQPNLAPAWYNLCGALIRLDRGDEANSCMSRLEVVAPELAVRLKEAMNASNPKSP